MELTTEQLNKLIKPKLKIKAEEEINQCLMDISVDNIIKKVKNQSNINGHVNLIYRKIHKYVNYEELFFIIHDKIKSYDQTLLPNNYIITYGPNHKYFDVSLSWNNNESNPVFNEGCHLF
jgi:hypothetical protein